MPTNLQKKIEMIFDHSNPILLSTYSSQKVEIVYNF
jgi:hypothetical protein